MCVIIYVPAGAKLPSYEELKAAHKNHPHGCGFACKSMHYKGMSFERFFERLQFTPLDEDLIIHFRYATHGSIGVKNCHPFKFKGMWFAHNGILSIKPREDMTDSETAFRDILAPAAIEYGLDSKEFAEIESEVRGHSKFAFIGKDGKGRLFGDFTMYNGRYYSNTRHLFYKSSFVSSYYKSYSYKG